MIDFKGSQFEREITHVGREMARRIPGARIVTITGTGHVSYI